MASGASRSAPKGYRGPRPAPHQRVRHPAGRLLARAGGQHRGRDHRLVQLADAQRRLPQVLGALDRPQPRLDAGDQLDLVGLALPEHVQDVVLGPHRQPALVQAGAQGGRVAWPPHPDHVLVVWEPAARGLLGGAAPVGRQQRPRALGHRLAADGGALLVGDGRVAVSDLFAGVHDGPDRQRILGSWVTHTWHCSPPVTRAVRRMGRPGSQGIPAAGTSAPTWGVGPLLTG